MEQNYYKYIYVLVIFPISYHPQPMELKDELIHKLEIM